MYRVAPFFRHFATSLGLGAVAASVWVNSDPASYYDFIEARLFDLHLPRWVTPLPPSITPMSIVSNGLMALFMFFVSKELWEALILHRGALSGRQALVPLGGIIGASLMGVLVWVLFGARFESAEEASFAAGWPVPIGGDVVLSYVFGRVVFGAGHPALHVLLLVAVGCDVLSLLAMGVAYPTAGLLRLAWLALPLAAAFGVWALYGRAPDPSAPETQRQRGLALWPYVVAGVLSFIGVAAAGLPPCLGLLPILPAIPHADRSFGVFSEAEGFLHDPLNRLAHFLIKPLIVVLFLFGLTRGGIDFSAFSPTTQTVLAAFWLGKPVGFILGVLAVHLLAGHALPYGVKLRDLLLVALLLGLGFTVPILGLESALPGGAMTEAARLGLALSLLIGPAAMALSRVLHR